MRVLLDHCVPKRAKRLFVGHEVRHTSEMGWEDLRNGLLIATGAAEGFDVLVTVDKGMRSQHRLDALPMPVIEIDTWRSTFDHLHTVAHRFDAALAATADFRFVSIAADGTLECLAPRRAT